MKKKLKIQAVLFLFFTSMLAAQESNVPAKEQSKKEAEFETSKTEIDISKSAFDLNPNSLGFNINYPLTGGLTYHRWINKFGIGITAGGIVTKDLKYIDYNIQLALQGLVFARDITRWFSTGLYVNTIAGHRGVKDYYYNSDKQMKQIKTDFSGFLGIGIGNEFLFARHVSITLECMIFGAYPWELTMGGGGSLKIRF